MISGAHAIIYSTDDEADRTFLREVLRLPYVDAGDGWLIFSLPPAEIAVHPARTSGAQEIYLLSDDIETFVQEMDKRGISCTPIESQRWGLLTHVTLPGGARLGVYEPRHARPKPMTIRAGPRRHPKPVVLASAKATRKNAPHKSRPSTKSRG